MNDDAACAGIFAADRDMMLGRAYEHAIDRVAAIVVGDDRNPLAFKSSVPWRNRGGHRLRSSCNVECVLAAYRRSLAMTNSLYPIEPSGDESYALEQACRPRKGRPDEPQVVIAVRINQSGWSPVRNLRPSAS